MKLILVFVLLTGSFQFGYAEVNSLTKTVEKNRIRWKNMNETQKTQNLEWQKENAEYILRNLDLKCGALKNIPDYTREHSLAVSGKTINPEDICFPSNSENLIEQYRTLGDYGKEFMVMRKAHEKDEDRLDPLRMSDWLMSLLAFGHYKEAVAFFPEFVSAVYSPLTKEEVDEKIKKHEPLPDYLAKGLVADFWDKILAVEDKPDDLGKLNRMNDEVKDPIRRIHRYFYSNDSTKKAAALDYYREKRIKFMIKKAHETWIGPVKIKADRYFEELQKSTTTQ